ncbi:uncharacterized protein [Coffea arabica]|uniref:Uncharacterized protein n=1 Tax=Coffea arabica TaxID=13443 RepID=A0ABM4X9D8_COFAR
MMAYLENYGDLAPVIREQRRLPDKKRSSMLSISYWRSRNLFFHNILDRLKESEGEARAAYSQDALQGIGGGDEFVNMMAIDGCFNLLVAFSILGQGIFGFKLGFEDSHSSFGTGFVRDNMGMWLQSMFLVGNQIPFVVLEQLMKLRFFEGLKRRYKWKQPSGLLKRAVHMLVTTELDPKPVDLIHCLQICLLGTRSGSDVGISIMVNDVGGDEVDDLPSAVELCRKGIAFAALEEGLGSRGIHYKHDPFNGVLYLPIFKVERYTALMVECLHKYEIVQKPRGIKPESTSFFKLLSELIRTEQDVELFSSQGVILGGSAEALPEILSEFDDVEPCDCEHFRHVRRQIKKYPPKQCWISTKRVIGYIMRNPGRCSVVFLLQFLQTYFTILAYYKTFS